MKPRLVPRQAVAPARQLAEPAACVLELPGNVLTETKDAVARALARVLARQILAELRKANRRIAH